MSQEQGAVVDLTKKFAGDALMRIDELAHKADIESRYDLALQLSDIADSLRRVLQGLNVPRS
jgi:hypothetical protein